MRRVALIVLVLFAWACVPKSPDVTPHAPAVDIRPGPVRAGGLFLQGFDVEWTSRPHRVRHLGVRTAGRMSADGREIVGELGAEVRGGTWASGRIAFDTPRIDVRYGAVAAEGLDYLHGSTTLQVVGQLGRRRQPDRPAAGTTTVEVPLPVDAGAAAPMAVWLTGFDIDTAPSHPNGYTPHAIAVWLGQPERVGDRVRFDVHARFEAAPVLDRAQQLAEYGATVRVDWAIAMPEGGATRRFGVRVALAHGVDPIRLGDRSEPARVPLTVDHLAPLPLAVAGLSGFEVDLLGDGPVDGRYLRALTVGLEDGRYDPARGTYDALVALRFANAGHLARPIRVEAAAEFTLLQLPRDADVREGRWSPPPSAQAYRVGYPSMEALEVVATGP